MGLAVFQVVLEKEIGAYMARSGDHTWSDFAEDPAVMTSMKNAIGGEAFQELGEQFNGPFPIPGDDS